MSSLWPDFSKFEKTKLPKTILEEQAEHLKQATEGRVYAIIKEKKIYSEFGLAIEDGFFRYSFEIRSKYSTTYKFELLSMIYPASFFPIDIVIGEVIAFDIESHDDLEILGLSTEEVYDSMYAIEKIGDIKELELVLKIIFNTESTKNIIGSIMSIE